MIITSYSREKSQEGLNKARQFYEGKNDQIRLLFTPTRIANLWEMKLNFLNGEYNGYSGSLLTACGNRQPVLF